jgi:lipoate-protein ligase A
MKAERKERTIVKTRILMSTAVNPWLNLAAEEYIFRDMVPDHQLLFLWRNTDTVVIGRYQNPWVECDVERMEADKVFLARRQKRGRRGVPGSGKHLLTFMSPRAYYSKERNTRIITNALAAFGITAYPSGRNDILVDERKVSGSAYKERSDRAFHHGTLLIKVDMGKLARYLRPNPYKLESKGIQSVRSRVANLTEFNPDIDHGKICTAIIREFIKEYGSHADAEELGEEEFLRIPELAEHYRELSDWEWRFGKTPNFSHRLTRSFPWGNLDIHLQCSDGRVTEARLFSDALYPDFVAALEESFVGVRYDMAALADTAAAAGRIRPETSGFGDDVAAWLRGEPGEDGKPREAG